MSLIRKTIDLHGLNYKDAMQIFQRAYFEAHMEKAGGKVRQVANATGYDRATLYTKLASLGIKVGGAKS